MRAKSKYVLVMVGALGTMAIVLSQLTAAEPDKHRKSETVAEHRNLEALIGTWQVTGQCFEKSETSPDSFTGTDKSEWVLGNRFVKCHLKGTKAGEAFEGIAISGYDTTKSKYVTTWQDNQCNSIKMEEGTYDSAAKTFTYTGQGLNPEGQTVQCRRVLKITGPDDHTMTAYVTESGKPEKKMGEMTFHRASRTASADKLD